MRPSTPPLWNLAWNPSMWVPRVPPFQVLAKWRRGGGGIEPRTEGSRSDPRTEKRALVSIEYPEGTRQVPAFGHPMPNTSALFCQHHVVGGR
jgi:hypothetical protein